MVEAAVGSRSNRGPQQSAWEQHRVDDVNDAVGLKDVRDRDDGLVTLSISHDEPAAAAESEPKGRKASPKAEQVAEQLRKLDLFNITPMQAMQWLNEMKIKLNS